MIKYNYSNQELKTISICSQIAELKTTVTSRGYEVCKTDYNIAVDLFNKQEEILPYIENKTIMEISDYKQCRRFLSEFIHKYRKKHNVTDFWHL